MSPPAAWWTPQKSFGKRMSTSQIACLATSCIHEPHEQMKTANLSGLSAVSHASPEAEKRTGVHKQGCRAQHVTTVRITSTCFRCWDAYFTW